MRRVAAFSDIHGNVEALDSVLVGIAQRGITELWCLGDVVGNGHDPVGCLESVEDAIAGSRPRAVVTYVR